MAAGLRGSSVDRLIESQEVQMTASDERVALRGICACTVRISEEEVSDFCSVLNLADRVLVAGSADAMTVAALFRLSLAEFGFDAHVLDTATVRHVEPAETRRRDRRTTAGCGPTDIVRIVVDAQAVFTCGCDALDSAAAPAGRCRHDGPVDRRYGIHEERIRRGRFRPHVSRRDPSMPSVGT